MSQDSAVSAESRPRMTFDISLDSTLTFTVQDGTVGEFLGGRILHSSGLSVGSPRGTFTLDFLVVSPLRTRNLQFAIDRPLPYGRGSDKSGAEVEGWVIEGSAAGGEGLVLGRTKRGFNAASRTMMLSSAEARISTSGAEALGDPSLAGLVLGSITIRADAEWVGGEEPGPVPEFPAGGGEGSRASGPDMTFCQLYGLGQYGRLGDIVGLSVATTSWNVGDAELLWHSSPSVDHPFIIMNLFRLKTVDGSERFEQIGQSWIKHGWCALDSTQCGGSCSPTGCGTLNVNCTDTYGASLNASQTGLAPRFEVDPWAGDWTYSGSHFQQYGSHSHDPIEHRLQVHDSDLNPAQNPGATYYSEGFYVCLDDVDVMNSVSWKPVTVSGSPGGTWSFGMSASYVQPETGFAVDAWVGAERTLLAEEIPVVEFVSPDGRCVLSAKATDLGGGQWHYEYNLLNIDMDRKVGSFSIPVTPGTLVSNIGFHAVEHHNEGGAGYSNDPWSVDTSGGAITWSTVNNPVRWGTLYNYRFDANVPPDTGRVVVTLGLYEPGGPSTVIGETLGPQAGPPDCNDNGIPDDQDIADCDGSPWCLDCNLNGIPDGCEADCQPNAIPDACDVDPDDPDGNGEVSEDCDGNGVPDECQPDDDGDGVPNACDLCPGFDDSIDADGDGVPDGCDACEGFDDNLDIDRDGVPDDCDNCINDFNPGQEDDDLDGIGNACDPDHCDANPLAENFATDPGWAVENVNVNDGAWEWGVPVGGGARMDPPDDYDGGGACYLTANEAGDSDVDGGPTRLYTPMMDLSSGGVTLAYAYWFGYSNPSGDDGLSVEVSDDNGGSWTEVALHNSVGVEMWQTNSVLLDDYVNPTVNTQIRFSVKDNPNNSVVEAAIDAVVITADCFFDCNGNEINDATDISNGTSEDCNENGIPDECDIASAGSSDCGGGPVGSISEGGMTFATYCSGCHGPDGSGGFGPDVRGYSRAVIWSYLWPDDTSHSGGAYGSFSQQDWADIEAFLADGGSRGRPDLVPDECQTLADCDGDGTADACELEDGTQDDLDYDGVPDGCCQTLPGDLDGSGGVAGTDIGLFVSCFLQGPSVMPGCGCADMNLPQPDGVLDNEDVTLFVAELLSD